MTRARRLPQAASLAALLTLACAGCDTPPTVTATPATPSPTIDSAAARAAFLAAAGAAQAQARALQSTGCATARTAAATRECWAQSVRIVHAYTVSVDATRFAPPADDAARTLVRADIRLEAAMRGLSAAPDPSRDSKDQNVYAAASADVLSAVAALRQSLGAPPPAADVPFY